jgi:hypothetical protein
MIITINETARPKLDRKDGAFVRHNQQTRDTLDQLKKQHGLCFADLLEGAVGAANESGWFLDLWIAKAQEAKNANRKNPQPRVLDESDQPELTPDDAVKNAAPGLLQAIEAGQLVAEMSVAGDVVEQSTPKEEPSNLWTQLIPAIIAVTGAENFETWLSCLRLFSASDSIVLSCPNTFFEEYLTQHYTAVIEQAFQETGEKRPVVFKVSEPTPIIALTPAPKQLTPKEVLRAMLAGITTLAELEAFETRTFPRIYQARILEAAQRVQRHQGDYFSGKRKAGFNEAQMAEEMAVLKTQRIEEEAARAEFVKSRREKFRVCRVIDQLRVKGNPRSQRQYAKASHWDTDGPLTRPDLKN